jgi:hypothetical protein
MQGPTQLLISRQEQASMKMRFIPLMLAGILLVAPAARAADPASNPALNDLSHFYDTYKNPLPATKLKTEEGVDPAVFNQLQIPALLAAIKFHVREGKWSNLSYADRMKIAASLDDPNLQLIYTGRQSLLAHSSGGQTIDRNTIKFHQDGWYLNGAPKSSHEIAKVILHELGHIYQKRHVTGADWNPFKERFPNGLEPELPGNLFTEETVQGLTELIKNLQANNGASAPAASGAPVDLNAPTSVPAPSSSTPTATEDPLPAERLPARPRSTPEAGGTVAPPPVRSNDRPTAGGRGSSRTPGRSGNGGGGGCIGGGSGGGCVGGAGGFAGGPGRSGGGCVGSGSGSGSGGGCLGGTTSLRAATPSLPAAPKPTPSSKSAAGAAKPQAKPQAAKPTTPKPAAAKPQAPKPTAAKPQAKPQASKPGTRKPAAKPQAAKPTTPKPAAAKPQAANRGAARPQAASRPAKPQARPQMAKPATSKVTAAKPQTRPQTGSAAKNASRPAARAVPQGSGKPAAAKSSARATKGSQAARSKR